MKAMSTQTMIIIAAIAVLVIGTIVYYAVAQRKSSFEDGDMPSGSPDMSDDEADAPMVPEDDSDPEAEE
jgi:heme/copper-type cytochrome/quinol oxidase subunit 2